MGMTNGQFTTSTTTAKQQAIADEERMRLRGRQQRYPQFRVIAEMAQAATWSLDCIEQLLDMADVLDGPVEPQDADGLTWDELAAQLVGWRWACEQMLGILSAHYTIDVEAAIAEWGEDDDDDDANDAEASVDLADRQPADEPDLADLPQAKGTPYWLG